MRKTIIFTAVILAGIISIPACKKTDTTDNTPSLTGLTITEAIPYVAKGADLVLKANVSQITSSSTTSKPGTIGLYWQVNSAQKDTLSKDIKAQNPEFKYHVDTLGTYSVSCYAFATGFYNSVAITTFEAIDPEKALTGIAAPETITAGGKQWTARNLSGTESGVSYKGASVVDPLFGRFYTFEEAVAACPSGWHLPSAEEWDALGENAGSLMVSASFLKNRMWEPALGQEISNSTGFNAIPVGYYDSTASLDKYRRYGQMAAFWTSSDSASDSNLGQFRFILHDTPTIMKGNGDKTSLALSVRCVKD